MESCHPAGAEPFAATAQHTFGAIALQIGFGKRAQGFRQGCEQQGSGLTLATHGRGLLLGWIGVFRIGEGGAGPGDLELAVEHAAQGADGIHLPAGGVHLQPQSPPKIIQQVLGRAKAGTMGQPRLPGTQPGKPDTAQGVVGEGG